MQTKIRNRFVETFPGESHHIKNPRRTPEVFYCRVAPEPPPNPKLRAWNSGLAQSLGIEDQELWTTYLSGQATIPGAKAYASRYGGHQFGHWAGQLGDGRAMTLCEWESPDSYVELQLKGAGLTPYSRSADGKAVLRSSIREYLMSEAMHFLGVPTTRALSLIETGEGVWRDPMYDGNPIQEPGAVVCRVAPSFLRFGHFEIFYAERENENLARLTEYCLSEFFPQIDGASDSKIRDFFVEVCKRTQAMVLHWCRVGFVHGVMNTDNMSILGLSIDYGPFGSLDAFDSRFTPNTTDLPGRRYAFGQQPEIAFWNLERLANALSPLHPRDELLSLLQDQRQAFAAAFRSMMLAKLGFDSLDSKDAVHLVKACIEFLEASQVDYTRFFAWLDEHLEPKDWQQAWQTSASRCLYAKATASMEEKFRHFHNLFHGAAVNHSLEERRKLRSRHNPQFLLRNYLLQQAIEAAEQNQNWSPFEQLYVALQNPYLPRSANDPLCQQRPDWANNKVGCSMLSCSS